ncbi:hypothetical protein EDD15DRAFT_2200512 [Pisolithus albus]|nr:hypothetical protein EDD15DRAFT_2200512 [Pisolithus albus]
MAVTTTWKVQHTRAKLSAAQRAERRQKLASLSNALSSTHQGIQEDIRKISDKYGRTLKWTKAQLYGGRLTRQRRTPSAWSALIARLLKEENKGSKLKLPEFVAMQRGRISREYCQLTPEDKAALVDEAIKSKSAKGMVRRANPKASIRDANKTFEVMEKEWIMLNARTGMEGFYIGVRGDVEQYHETKIFCTAKAASFIKDVLDIEPKRLALKLESWVVGNFQSSTTPNQYLSRVKLNFFDAILISKGLPIKKTMNYINYESKIVEKYSVALHDWPSGRVCSPGEILRREDLLSLLDTLMSGSCAWRSLTKEELTARQQSNATRQAQGEQIYRPCKPHTSRKVATVVTQMDNGVSENAGAVGD